MENLRTGEKIAGASGLALLIIMFLGWWGVPGLDGAAAETAEALGVGDVSTTFNAWEPASFLDIIWFLTAVSGIALAALAFSRTQTNMPVALSAITAGLGILSVLTILFRILSTPYDLDRKYGVFLGLLAAAGVAYGGWKAMQEEGTSFSQQADRLQDRGPGGPGGPPSSGGGTPPPPPPSSGGTAPPPPPTSPPPPSGGPAGPAA